VFGDNGYNGTPVWTAIGGFLARHLPLESGMALPLLVAIDLLLLALAFATIRTTFGASTAMLSFGLFGTLFVMAPGHIRVSFLRLDWFAALLLATCMLKRRHYGRAGALVAYAGMVRIVPFVFAFGLAAKWLRAGTAAPDARRFVRFFLGLSLTMVALFALSLAGEGTVADWRSFAEKIRAHDEHVAENRLGFRYAALGAATLASGAAADVAIERLREHRAVWWGIQAAVIWVSFFAVRRLEDYETVPFGYVLAYFLTAPTYYYHVMLVVLGLLFLPKLGERARAHGAAALFGFSILGYVLWAARSFDARRLTDWTVRRLPEIDMTISTTLSVALLAISIGVIAFALRRPLAR
jgi:hypothetical protein